MPAAFGLAAWQARLKRSVLLATDDGSSGRWQKWLEPPDAVFYLDTGPDAADMPFQWDPPLGWATSPLDLARAAIGAQGTAPPAAEVAVVSSFTFYLFEKICFCLCFCVVVCLCL